MEGKESLKNRRPSFLCCCIPISTAANLKLNGKFLKKN